MYHSHFNSIHSTQIYLKDNLSELRSHSNDVLISAAEQTQGLGRKGGAWDSYPNALAMSFTISPNHVPTLTPLELGILTTEFIKNKLSKDIFLKWPNDLLTSETKKCGGIIAQYIDKEIIIAGIGINLGETHCDETPSNYKNGLGVVFDELKLNSEELSVLSADLYQYILYNRILSIEELQKKFLKTCSHIGLNVLIEDTNEEFIGKFVGIGKNGEALLEMRNEIKSFISSSLTVIS